MRGAVVIHGSAQLGGIVLGGIVIFIVPCAPYISLFILPITGIGNSGMANTISPAVKTVPVTTSAGDHR